MIGMIRPAFNVTALHEEKSYRSAAGKIDKFGAVATVKFQLRRPKATTMLELGFPLNDAAPSVIAVEIL